MAAVTRIADLPRRQREVALRISVGETNREVATAMGVSLKTFDTHRAVVLRRLGLRNNVELARRALQEGAVTL